MSKEISRKMEVILYKGRTCPKCPAFEAILQKVTTDYKVVYIEDDMTAALMHQVAAVPTLVVDGEPMLFGEVTVAEVKEALHIM
jgi:glutaredoxin